MTTSRVRLNKLEVSLRVVDREMVKFVPSRVADASNEYLEAGIEILDGMMGDHPTFRRKVVERVSKMAEHFSEVGNELLAKELNSIIEAVNAIE